MYTDRANGTNDPITNAPMDGTVGTVAATGSVIGDAAALPASLNKVTGADATKGVALPSCPNTNRLSTRITVINAAAAVLKVWPASGGTINGGSASAAVSLAANTIAYFHLYAADTWFASECVNA